MDWANERYVRLFVRDTTTWKLLPWQSRALLPLILRKLDRSGVIDLGDDGEEGLAAIVEVPVEFLQAGLPELLRRNVFKMAGAKFVMPNFLAAQEAKQSDAQRKRESRERQRLEAMQSQPVTAGHNVSESQTVTGCPPVSVLVTPDQTRTSPDPSSLCGPSSLSAPDPDRARSNGNANKPTGHELLAMFGRLRREILNLQSAPGTERPKDTNGKAATFAEQLTDGEAVDVMDTMILAIGKIKAGAAGWDHASMVDPAFAFGAWSSRFAGLREELHGIAPKPAPQKNLGPKPVIWRTA